MRLSIITINYNNKLGLQRTIDSIISQTFQDFEWIVIDGGSNDGSVELIKKYEKYFSYWCSEPDKGVYNAQNKGIILSKGEYLNFMNSGDEFYEKDTLEKVFKTNIDSDIVYGDWMHILPSGKTLIQKAPHTMSLMYIFTDNICHQAMFTKAYILKEKGFDENLKIFSDWLRWREVALAKKSFTYVPYIICKYEAGGLSGTSSPQNTYERNLLYSLIPKDLKADVDEHAKLKAQLYRYENNLFMKETYNLIFERPLYCHFIHLNLIILKTLKKVIDFLKL